MDQDNNQNGQKSSFDRANDAVNKTRSAYKKVKNLKKAYRMVRTVQTVQTLIGGFSPIIWAIVGALIMVAASTFFLAVMGGGAGSIAETPEEPPTVSVCADIPGATCKTTCATDETENTTVTDCSPNRCCAPQLPPTEEITCASISGAYCTANSSDSCRPGTQQNSTITSCSPNKCCVPNSSENPGNDIKAWGEKIAAAIRPYPNKCYAYGPPGYTMWNVLTTRFSNNGHTTPYSPGTACGGGGATFLCTNFVISSYKLAGYNGNYDTSVFDMVKKWESNPGYKVLRGDNVQSISLLKPGDVIFMGDSPNGLVNYNNRRHVVMVQGVTPLNANGDGTIYVLRSNDVGPYGRYGVRGGRIVYNYLGGGADQFWFGLGPRN